MEEITEHRGQEQTKKSDETQIEIGNFPVMQSALDVMSVLGRHGKVFLRSRGNSIPNAVAIANIITEKMMKDSSKVEKITLDTVAAAGIGDMTSTIEIILQKI